MEGIMKNEFNFCPICGSKEIHYKNRKKWFCDSCGFDLYNNVASATGIILYDSSRNILTEVRAKDPRKGFLALPGGFCDYDETAEEAVVRECVEETGFKPETVEYLGSFPNDYEYKGIAYKTCDLFFTAKLPEKYNSIEELIQNLNGQASEVTGFKSVQINNEKDIEKADFAFSSAKKALSLWLKKDKQ